MVALLLEANAWTGRCFPPGGLALNTENTVSPCYSRDHGREQRYPHSAFRTAKACRTAGPQPGLSRVAAALFQRLDRHKEAIDQYQAGVAPRTVCGHLVAGSGDFVSGRRQTKDALEAFTRAKSAGSLAPDLLGFVEQRLRQLQ